MPAVSIIIPAYKAEKFIVRTIKSVLTQSFTDWEAIIVSDDTIDYQTFLSNHNITDKRLRFASTGKIGSGPSNARNIALDMAKSDIIATLDADDTFDKRKLEMMLPMAQKYGLVVSNIRIIDYITNKKLPNFQYKPRSRLINYRELLATTCYGHSTVMFKKLQKPFYWNSEIKHCEDLVFMSQLYDYFGEAYYFYYKLHNYYLHPDSLCHSNDSQDNFAHDRSKIISLLNSDEIMINNSPIKNMLIDFIKAGQKINEKHQLEDFSYEVYISELKQYCSFLPNRNIWK